MTRFNLVNGDYVTFDLDGNDSSLFSAMDNIGESDKTYAISGNEPIRGKLTLTPGIRTTTIRNNTSVIIYMNDVTSIEHNGTYVSA